MFAIHRNIHDCALGLSKRRAKLLEVPGIGRREMSRPRLDFIDIKFLDDMSCKIFQVERVGRFIFLSGDEVAKGIGRDRDPLTRLGGKVQVWTVVRRE